MPYKSDAQRRYFNANREELESQGVDVDEWNQASKGKKLPEKVEKDAYELGLKAAKVDIPHNLDPEDFLESPNPAIGIPAAGVGGALSGAMMGGLTGSVYGAGKGNMAEGLGRGILRGGATGAGAALGSHTAHRLGGGGLMQLLAMLGGGAAGYIGSGKLLGKGYGEDEGKKAAFELGKQAFFGAPAATGAFTPPPGVQPAPSASKTTRPASIAPTTPSTAPQQPAVAGHTGVTSAKAADAHAFEMGKEARFGVGRALGGLKNLALGRTRAGFAPHFLASAPAVAYAGNQYMQNNPGIGERLGSMFGPSPTPDTPAQIENRHLYGTPESIGTSMYAAGQEAGMGDEALSQLGGDVRNLHQRGLEDSDIRRFLTGGIDAQVAQGALAGAEGRAADAEAALARRNSPWHAENQPQYDLADFQPPQDMKPPSLPKDPGTGIPDPQVQQAGMAPDASWFSQPGLLGMTRGQNALLGAGGIGAYLLWKKMQEDKERERSQAMMPPMMSPMMMGGGGGGGSRGAFFF